MPTSFTDLTPVESSTVAGVGYDDNEQTLTVRFKTGATYRYDGVPQAIADQLLSAASPGRFLHGSIKGRFPYRRIG